MCISDKVTNKYFKSTHLKVYGLSWYCDAMGNAIGWKILAHVDVLMSDGKDLTLRRWCTLHNNVTWFHWSGWKCHIGSNIRSFPVIHPNRVLHRVNISLESQDDNKKGRQSKAIFSNNNFGWTNHDICCHQGNWPTFWLIVQDRVKKECGLWINYFQFCKCPRAAPYCWTGRSSCPMCARLHSADSVREASAHGEKAAQRPRKANGLERHLAGPPPLSWAWNGALSLAERRGRNPRAARNPARNPRLDQSGETRLYRSNSLNRQDCFSPTLLLPGCSSTTASSR